MYPSQFTQFSLVTSDRAVWVSAVPLENSNKIYPPACEHRATPYLAAALSSNVFLLLYANYINTAKHVFRKPQMA